jgi:dipeptidyl aminopeptidase/acylaminoacyl peptidase
LLYALHGAVRPKSVAAIFPPSDFAAWCDESPKWREIILSAHAAPATPQFLRKLSPLHRATDFRDLPLYILHGDADSIVPVEQSRNFVRALRSSGAEVVYREIPGGGHDDGIATDYQGEIVDFLQQAASH